MVLIDSSNTMEDIPDVIYFVVDSILMTKNGKTRANEAIRLPARKATPSFETYKHAIRPSCGGKYRSMCGLHYGPLRSVEEARVAVSGWHLSWRRV